MTSKYYDTIAAISTPLGEGGIAIVRLSGKNALSAADAVFEPPTVSKPSLFLTHTVHYGKITDPVTKDVIDEVMLTVLLAPKTYTREDVVEISCHGGAVTARKVLEACIAAGARLAEPGEFTKRAFLNGRLDLSQAEAVLDIIKAETDASRKVALGQLKGHLSEEIKSLRRAILDALSRIELTIDFSQEDVALPDPGGLKGEVESLERAVSKLLETSGKGMMIRHGASIVICGRPNVGKSSLMNALLRHDRVIVADIAGTTRDVIEESIEIAGVRMRISDTAGMIETADRVELEGIRRSKEKLEHADIVIFILDSSVPVSPRDERIFVGIKDKKVVIAVNKSDLPPAWELNEISRKFGVKRIIRVSARERSGLLELEDSIAGALMGDSAAVPEGPVVTSLRHKDLLEKARVGIERGLKVTGPGYNPELLAADLNEVVYLLGLITGESVGDDVLDRIFSQFCIGK
jgi:tRNA modification GTPase